MALANEASADLIQPRADIPTVLLISRERNGMVRCSPVSRAVTDGLTAWTASSMYNGRTITSQLTSGVAIDFGHGVTLAPEGGVQYGRLALDSATERGDGVLSLVLPARVVRSTRSLAGIRVAKAFGPSGDPFTIEGRTSWSHEFRRIGDLRMHFAGDTWTDGFDLAAPRQSYKSALARVTFAGRSRGNLRLFATIDSELSGSLTTWTGNAGVVKSW